MIIESSNHGLTWASVSRGGLREYEQGSIPAVARVSIGSCYWFILCYIQIYVYTSLWSYNCIGKWSCHILLWYKYDACIYFKWNLAVICLKLCFEIVTMKVQLHVPPVIRTTPSATKTVFILSSEGIADQYIKVYCECKFLYEVLIIVTTFSIFFLLLYLLPLRLLYSGYSAQLATQASADAAYFRVQYQGLLYVFQNVGTFGPRWISTVTYAVAVIAAVIVVLVVVVVQ